MDQVSQIREKVDIVSLISEFIPLKKAGRNFKANCPFHGEKTPSFVVSPERQIWHCFGCGLGGDCYTFLMEYEKMEFPEALRVLAKRTGITLVSDRATAGTTTKKELLYEINSFAKEYYHYVLTKLSVGKQALDYVLNRGISMQLIETFKIGFSPSTDQSLVNYLTKKKKYNNDDVLDAGLAFVGRGGLVDFFRGRLMFPLIDHRDNVVGFSGRVLEGDAPSKYINTRETLVYHKGEHVFGLNITKEAIRREKQAIVVEGEFDVLSCFGAGVGNVVAVKGTALTDSHVNLLHRYAQKITFCFDDDKAGQEAIKRSLIVVEKKGLTPTVIVLPNGKDPDEAIKTEPGLFKKAVKEDVDIYDYLLDVLQQSYDIFTAEGKSEFIHEFFSFVVLIENEIKKEHYLRKLSSITGTTLDSIKKELQRWLLLQKQVSAPAAPTEPVKKKRPREEMLEEYVLALIVQSENPKKAIQSVVRIFSDSMSRERAYQKILLQLIDHIEATSHQDQQFDGKAFGDALPHELVGHFNTSVLFPLPQFDSQDQLLAEISKKAGELRRLYLQQKIKQLSEEINKKEEHEDVSELRKKYTQLARQLEL